MGLDARVENGRRAGVGSRLRGPLGGTAPSTHPLAAGCSTGPDGSFAGKCGNLQRPRRPGGASAGTTPLPPPDAGRPGVRRPGTRAAGRVPRSPVRRSRGRFRRVAVDRDRYPRFAGDRPSTAGTGATGGVRKLTRNAIGPSQTTSTVRRSSSGTSGSSGKATLTVNSSSSASAPKTPTGTVSVSRR